MLNVFCADVSPFTFTLPDRFVFMPAVSAAVGSGKPDLYTTPYLTSKVTFDWALLPTAVVPVIWATKIDALEEFISLAKMMSEPVERVSAVPAAGPA